MSRRAESRDKNPTMSRAPPTSSTKVTTYAMSSGAGTPGCERNPRSWLALLELLQLVREHNYPDYDPHSEQGLG